MAVGSSALATGADSIAIGAGATTSTFTTAIAIGRAAAATANNDGQWGSSANPVDFQSHRRLAWKRQAAAADANATNTVIVGVTDTSAPRTITLLTADLLAGRVIIVKDESGAAGTNNITIATEGAELIDGAATATISTNYGVVRLYSDGTNWFTF